MTKETKTIHQAIFAVQQAAPSIKKDTDNPFFKSKYADLPSIWDAIREIMGENGLYVSSLLDAGNDGDFIVTKIIHAPSGESVESKSRITLNKVTAQEYGSFITYMRRYALSAMLGLVTDEDDDGNAATQAQAKAPVKQEKKSEATPEQKAFMQGAMTEFKAMTKSEQVTEWVLKNLTKIETLTPDQQKWLNDQAAGRKKSLEAQNG